MSKRRKYMELAAMGLAAALLCAGRAAAEATLWLPDGKEVRQAVEARAGQTALAKLAATMDPGSWASLKTTVPPGLWTSPKINGGRNAGGSGGLHIAGWTDDAHWDSRTGQFLYMGLRQTRRFIAYSETNNTWRSINLDPKSDNPCFRTRFGHIYSGNGFDHERSRFYHRYNGFESEKEGLKLEGGISFFDVLTEKWTKLPPKPAGQGGGMAIEFSGALDGIVSLGPKPCIFSSARQRWEPLGASPVSGYHSLIRHNPYRHEVLMAGGNHNPRVVARITKEGKIERLKDFPTTLSVQSDKISVDPQSGRYLILAGNKGEPKQLYEFDSNEKEYRVVASFMAGWPYGRSAMPVCAFIPEYGVIMWAEPQGVHLYKHDPSIRYPPAAAILQTSVKNGYFPDLSRKLNAPVQRLL